MKKVILALVLVSLILAGCGKPEAASISDALQTASPETEPTAVPATAPTTVPTTVPETQAETEPIATEPRVLFEFPPFTVEKQVIFDQYDVTVTTDECGVSPEFGAYVDLIFENHGSEYVMFNWGYHSVNGLMAGWETMLFDVPPGETNVCRLYPFNPYVDSEAIMATGLQHLGQIRIHAGFSRGKESMDIAPLTIQVSDAMEAPALPEATECYNNGGLRITASAHGTRETYGNDFHVLVENHTDRNLYLIIEPVSVNGIPVGEDFGIGYIGIDHSVLREAAQLFRADLSCAALEAYGISDAEEIQVRFILTDDGGLENVYAESGVCTLVLE